jgi:ligand-binding sensor domain-containing protein/signal transduction histidine kinase
MAHPSSLSLKICRNFFASMLFLIFLAHANAAPSRTLRFEKIGVEQGLPQESITTILQDSQGFMWFGTQAGLVKFDGYRMTVHKSDPRNAVSLIDNFVLSSYEDVHGGLWFGTKGGLNHYDRLSQQFTRYVPDGLILDTANRTVTAITTDGTNGLWLATEDGLKHFDFATRKFTTFRHDAAHPGSLRDDRVSALARDQHGNLLIGTSIGLDYLKPGERTFGHIKIDLNGKPREKQNSIRALSVARDNTLWIGSDAGLAKLALDQQMHLIDPVKNEKEFVNLSVQTLLHDKDNQLWIGTNTDGMKRRDPSTGIIHHYHNQILDGSSLAGNDVRALFQDRTGALWIGTWFDGISRVDLASGGFERFIKIQGDANSLSDNKIRSIIDDGHGAVWLATLGGGLNLLNPKNGTVKTWRHKPDDPTSLNDDNVVAVEHGEPGRVWVGTRTGLSWLVPATAGFNPVFLGTDLKENNIQKLLLDRKAVLWVLTQGGLHRRDPGSGKIQTFRHKPNDKNSLGENFCLAALEDSHGTLWIGTENGLDRLDQKTGQFTHFRHDENDPRSVIHNRIHYLLEDSKGQIWVGTAGGLTRMINEKDGKQSFQFYPTKIDGSADSIGGILEDKSGHIWISSTSGISRLTPDTGRFKHYTAKDGLLNGSYFVGSAYRSNEGTLFFGGMSGLTSFNPSNIQDNPFQPALEFTDFLIFNRSTRTAEREAKSDMHGRLTRPDEVNLNYRDSVFSLEFSALHFADPQRNRYKYMLEGFDKAWVETDASKRFATYTNLDPGRYVFRVKGSNKDGVWNDTGIAMSIQISPPYWKTWWFRILAAALTITTILIVFRLRMRSLFQQKTVLEQQVSRRTSELQHEKKIVEQQKESVEQAHRNISLLSAIGREITAELDSEAIITMLYRNVNELMDATVFGIGFYRPDLAVIEYPFAIEAGKRYAPYTRDMNDPNQLPVWCMTHQREVVINDLEQEYSQYITTLDLTSGTEYLGTLDDGTLPVAPQSLLYVPILANGQVRGVIGVHSYVKNAYEPIHTDILRTLASYVGVALDNADAYSTLKETQQQLIEQGKLAGLGSLVAGVAHELNTPIGNSLMIASTLQEKTEAMARLMTNSTMRRSDLNAFIASAQEASVLIMRSLKNAANLINSFKQVAVDQTSAKRRRFNLLQATQEIVATMINQLRKAGHTLELEIPPDIEMDSYPGPYSQVIINFIANVLLHAFDLNSTGKITLSADLLGPDTVQIRFHDNGMGIPPEDISRIFEPFFTTKFGQGGSGLGLNISYNIVTSLLEGQIRVESVVGQGTTFILELPLSVSTSGD